MYHNDLSGALRCRIEQLRKCLEEQTGISALFFLADRDALLGGENLSQEQLTAEHRLCKGAIAQGQVKVCRGDSGLWRAIVPVGEDTALRGAWLLDGFCLAEQGGLVGVDVPLFNHASLNMLLSYIEVLSSELCSLLDEERLSFIHPMLGIPNQLALDRDLQTDQENSLLLLDIQGLQKINDVHGRECGDRLLRRLSDYLLSLGIPGAKLYHSTVVDFVLVIDRQKDEDLCLLAKQMYNRCRGAWFLDDNEQELFIVVNIGVLPLGVQEYNVFHNLTSAIEHTMDLARNGNGVAMFDDAESMTFRDRLRLELSLAASVREKMRGFSVMFQPIADPGTAMWNGLEVLCRWNSPEFGIVVPDTFIPIAESTGFIYPIGKWVLEQGLAAAKKWGLDSQAGFQLNVNLSPIQLLNPGLYLDVKSLLEQYNYPPEKLCLEITENNELNFTQHSLDEVRRINSLGVAIALDDFGAGYAGRNSLHILPASLVKADRSLAADVEKDPFLQELFSVLIDVAHASNMRVVAEGVENSDQALLLLQSGVDLFQGYYFSHPLQAEQVEESLDNFKNPVDEVACLGYNRMDLSRLSDEQGGYELTTSLYKLLARCMRVLFSVRDGNEAILTALAYIGQELGVSRSYVFIKQSNGLYTNTHEWCAEGITPEKDNLKDLDLDVIASSWTDTLSRKGLLVASDINELDSDSFDLLIEQDIKAVVEFAIMQDGQLHGFVGFDDCVAIHHWTSEEIQMLHTLTGIIASTLQRMQLERQTVLQNERMTSMLDTMNTYIYVSDLETHEILFANSALQASSKEPFVGKICWEALQGKKEQCSFCPIPRLLENPGESYQWEFYNEWADAHFRVQDSLIPWDDGRLVHLEYALDITEIKNYQSKLEEFASIDMLTRALNRVNFFEQAYMVLREAQEKQQTVSLAFIDIDGLKAENDKRGHGAGDLLIQSVTSSLRQNMRSTDLIGRYGGDEFLVLLPNCSKRYAKRRLRQAAGQLAEIGSETGRFYSFSYGLADTREFDYTEIEALLEAMIETADQRMIVCKHARKRQRTV